MQRTSTPLLLAALFKPLCPLGFTTTIVVPSSTRVRHATVAAKHIRSMSTTDTALSSSATQVANTDHHPQPAPGEIASGNGGGGGSGGGGGGGNEVSRTEPTKHRQSQKSWRKKDGNTKSRGMKRGRVQQEEAGQGAKDVDKRSERDVEE